MIDSFGSFINIKEKSKKKRKCKMWKGREWDNLEERANSDDLAYTMLSRNVHLRPTGKQ